MNYSRKRLKQMYLAVDYAHWNWRLSSAEALEISRTAMVNIAFANMRKLNKMFEKETGRKNHEKEIRKEYYIEHGFKYDRRRELITAYNAMKEAMDELQQKTL